MSAAATDTGTETGTGTEPDEPLPRALWPVRCLAVGYVGLGVWLMLAAAPRVPYADPYRFLARFLTLPFPASVVAPDNGHREVLPNLVRWAEARWLDADQWLQLAVGTTLVLLAFAAILRALRRAPRAARTAAAAIVCVGLFWLGNWRKLVHHNESVSFGFVLLWLALGLTALGRGTRGGAVTAGLMGVLATMSFGSGPACFAAFLLVLLLQRAPFGRWLPVLVGAVAAAALLLTAGGEAPRAIGLAPGTQLVDLLHWLGAPFVWALNPLLDAAHAARLPEPFATVAGWIAGPVERSCGPALVARLPAALFGGAGLLWLAVAAVRAAFRHDTTSRGERFGLGLAAFGAAVGVLVVIARLHYFRTHPQELVSTRYVPWVMLFWTGLTVTFVLAPHRRPLTAALTALAVLLLFLPSQIWTGRYAFKQLDSANLTAIGAIVGVIDRDFPLVETDARDLLVAVPVLREHRSAMFAWPEADLIGGTPAVDVVAIRDVEIVPVTNLFDGRDGEGAAVAFRSAAAPANGRLLLTDAAGAVCGLAVHCRSENRWRGWLRGPVAPAALAAATLVERP